MVMWKIFKEPRENQSKDSDAQFLRFYEHENLQTALIKAMKCCIKCIDINQCYKIDSIASCVFESEKDSFGLYSCNPSAKSPQIHSNNFLLQLHCAVVGGIFTGVHCGGIKYLSNNTPLIFKQSSK